MPALIYARDTRVLELAEFFKIPHIKTLPYDFDLYTLVPQNAVAVFETDRILDFYDSVERMHSSRDGHYLSVSELFNRSNDFFDTLLVEVPHVLSKQMNKVLVSFHEPDISLNQVMYAALE